MDVYQRRRLVALSALAGLLIVVVLLIRSCGGDDEAPITALGSGATGAGGAQLSQKDYIREADSVCLQANTSLGALDSSDPARSATDQARIVSGELSQLQTLTLAPGEAGADELDAFLAALEQQAAALLDLSVAAERGDDSATAEIQGTADEAASRAAKAARKFGFEACGDTSQVSETSGGGGGGGGSGAVAPAGTTEVPTTTVPSTPTTTAPIVPTTPTTTEAPPTTPVPSGGGGAAPNPTPAPSGGDTGSDSGGVSP